MSRWFRTWRVSTFAAFLLVLMVTAIQPSFTAFASCGPNNVCWSELYHDSRDPLYRTPTGPAPINSSVTIRFRTAANDVGGVDLRVYNTKLNQNNFFPMAKVATDGTHDYWAYTVNTGATFNILYYWFRINDGSATVFYEDDAASADLNHRFWGGTGAPSANSNDRSWALTVYDPAFTTPDWVKNGVFYQIFPDRFRDGNPANNLPSGTFFYNEAGGTITRSLTNNWNTAICDPRADSNDGCEGSWSRNFYGGDLLGIQNQLQYLKSLGVTVIYMTPIFEAPSNHKYDARDFSVVDDNFGGDAALTALVNAAHAEGMYVVLDGVFNHVSSDSPYFDRYGQYATVGACESANSPYAGLFKPFFPHVPSAQDPTAPCSDNRDYPGWFGFDSLPEFDSATPGGLARQAIWDGGIVHPSGKNAEIGTYWITDFNIDGWRLDVANDVDPSGSFGTNDYWENFRDRVKAADPEAYIVGEFWGIGTQWISGGLANGYTATGSNPGEWDAVMNYQQTSMLMGFWRDSALETENDFNPGSLPGKLIPHSPSMLTTRYYDLVERYPEEAFYAMMNLNGSHDTQRALWLLDETIPLSPANGTAYPSAQNHYEVGQPGAEAVQNLKGFSLMQYTLPGAPQIYYGTEVGLVNPTYYHNGKWEDDPYNRAPFPWADQSGTPYYTHMRDGNSVRTDLLNHFTVLGTTRNAHASLRTGEFVFSLVDDANKQLGYYRYMPDGSDAAVVLANRGAASASMTISLGQNVPVGAVFEDAFTGATYTTVAGAGGTSLTVPSVAANSAVLLVLDSGAYSVPGRPAIGTTVLSGTSIQINWLDINPTGTYSIYRSVFAGGGQRTLVASGVTGSTYTDATVASGRTYYYTVEAISAAGVSGGASNESAATPFYDLSGSYRNVQSPTSLTHTISATTPTATVYGQIYVAGVTDAQSTPVDGLSAQLGYGAAGSNPSLAGWTWVDATPNAGVAGGNNDEFQASLLPDAVGTYSYTYRYSSDGGQSWVYATDSIGNACDEAIQPGFALCTLIVNPSADTTAPSAPVLTKSFDTTTQVGLSWTASTDNVAVQGYRVYRSTDGGASFQLVATLPNPATLTYTDTNVTANAQYQYKVVAYDTSFNPSVDSNTVNAEAVNTPVNVTFEVEIPAFTEVASAVQIIGGHPALSNWSSGVDMSQDSPNQWSVTLSIAEGSAFPYKFRRDGSWDKVEKAANGYDEIPDRQYTVGFAENGPYTVNHTVANWRDVLVTGISVADGATDVGVTTAYTVTFNKSVNAGTVFSVAAPNNEVAFGTFARSNDELSVTFTPNRNLRPAALYTVTVGSVSAAGDGGRFFTNSYTFTTAASMDMLPPATVVLTKVSDFDNAVSLSWTASSDDVALYGYRYYRSSDNGTNFTLIGSNNDGATLTFTDTSVVTGTTYQYYVTAYDSSYNESVPSNTVTAVAQTTFTTRNFLRNTGFESGLGTRWVLQGANNGDARVCGVPNAVFAGNCAFQFVGSLNEFTTLSQTKLGFNPGVLAVGDQIVASAYFRTRAGADLRMRVRVRYANGTSSMQEAIITGEAGYREIRTTPIVLTRTDVTQISVVISNRSAGRFSWVDNVTLLSIRTDPTRAAGVEETPLTLPDADVAPLPLPEADSN